MRIGVGLGPNETVKCTAVVEMIFDKGWRHPLDADNRRATGSVVMGE